VRRALKSMLMLMWKYNAKGNPKCNKWDGRLCSESSKDTPKGYYPYKQVE